MKKLRFISIIYTLLLVLLTPLLEVQAQQNETKNILFVIVDDLRLQAGVFGQDQMITPNLDKIGQEGLVFNRAYCQVPTCGASRASLRFGKGETIITEKYMYTEYRDKDGKLISKMLTDLEKDPKQNESIIWQYEENKVLKELEDRLREYQK